jgi:hypothetical protein
VIEQSGQIERLIVKRISVRGELRLAMTTAIIGDASEPFGEMGNLVLEQLDTVILPVNESHRDHFRLFRNRIYSH